MNLRKFLKARNIDQVVGLDFETYFAKDYSLRQQKRSTTSYVRDEQFKAQCIGIRTLRQRKAKWYPHEKIAKALAQYDWSRTAMLAHNTAFDGLICQHHYGIVPGYYFDTMSMTRPIFSHVVGASLDEVARFMGYAGKVRADALIATKGIRDLPPELMKPLGDYCADDVNEMWSIFMDFLGDYDYPEDELDLINMTINMYANPVLTVDRPRAEAELKREIKKKRRIVNGVAPLMHTKGYEATAKALNSRERFAEALRAQGIEPPKKISATTGKPTYAFAQGDLEFQALFKHENKAIQALVKAKQISSSSIGETRARRLLDHSKPPHALPLMLNYCRAHTMRWSGGDKMNPQNFVRGGELRRSIRAPKGYKVIVVDSGQVEARYNGWLAGDEEFMETFRLSDAGKGPDPYCLLATDIYRRVITKKDKMERFVGKVGILGLGFGMAHEKYRDTLAAGSMGPPVFISPQEAVKVVQVYRTKRYRIKNQWRALQRLLTTMYTGGEATYGPMTFFGEDGNGYVEMPNGLLLHYPKLKAKYDPRREELTDFEYWNGKHFTRVYGGLFTENVVQSGMRIAVGEQALMIAEKYRVVTLSHDEVVYLAPTAEAEKAYEYGLECLTTTPAWTPGLPLSAEGGWDDMYSK